MSNKTEIILESIAKDTDKQDQVYLESLADQYDVDIDIVWALDSMLGENERYDGLIDALEEL